MERSYVLLKEQETLPLQEGYPFPVPVGEKAISSPVHPELVYAPQAQPWESQDIEKLRLLLDAKHSEQWGLKEYYKDVNLELRPDLPWEKLFKISDGRLKWIFREDPLFLKMEEDFHCAQCSEREAQSCYGPERSAIEAWRNENAPKAGMQHIDLLYLSRYDHQAYAHFPEHPNDPWGYLNTDRFFFSALPEKPSIDAMLGIVGNLHLHIHELSSMLIPGFTDRDSIGLDGLFCLLFVSRTEHQAKAVVRRLKSFGKMLAIPSRTLEIRGLSLEALENFPNRENSIYDLLGKTSTMIASCR